MPLDPSRDAAGPFRQAPISVPGARRNKYHRRLSGEYNIKACASLAETKSTPQESAAGFSSAGTGGPFYGPYGHGREKTLFSHRRITTLSLPGGRHRLITRLSLTADPQEPSVPAGLAGDNRPQPSSPHQHQEETAPASPTNFSQSPIRIHLAGLSPTPSLRKPTNYRPDGLRAQPARAQPVPETPREPTDALPDSPRALPGRARPYEITPPSPPIPGQKALKRYASGLGGKLLRVNSTACRG